MYRLARDLGVWDVDALYQNMSAVQYEGWAEFYAMEHEHLKPKPKGAS